MYDLMDQRLVIERVGAAQAQGRGLGHCRFERLIRVHRALELGLRVTGLQRVASSALLRPRVEEVRVSLPRLPSVFEGYRILFLSDLHIDADPGLMSTVLARLKALQHMEIDTLWLGGDLRYGMEGAWSRPLGLVVDLLRALRFRDRSLGVLGNHDTTDVLEPLMATGLHWLLNTAACVEREGQRLWIVGVDDPHYYGTDDLGAALAGVPAGDCRILIAHSPELYAEAAAAGVDFYCCGHTHGGQIRIPGLPPPVYNAACPRALAAGPWRVGAMVGYTSRGVGASGVPARFCCPPEITVLELRSATAETAGCRVVRNHGLVTGSSVAARGV